MIRVSWREKLLANALPAAPHIRELKRHVSGVPVVYVNDNFGRWQSSF